MEAKGGNKLSKNIINFDDKTKLINQMVIYGANSSGKTNLVQSILFMWRMVTQSHNFNIGDKIPRIPFKLDNVSSKNPSKFEINFIQDEIKYLYGFSCNEDKFLEEYLYYWPKGKESLIFKREEGNKFDFNIEEKLQKTISKQTIQNTLYLSRATQLGFEKTKPVYEFFKKNIVININLSDWDNYTINSIFNDKKLKDKIVEFLKKTDFGGIDDILIKKEKTKIKQIKFDGNGMSQNDVEEDILNLKFIHRIDGEDFAFNFSEESKGTQRTFSMLGPLFDILENGKVVIIDEIESSLHPKIVQFLIRLFNSRHNKKNAQLILTTHNLTLLNQELFRKDQFYFCEKESNHSTQLVSMSEYDIRQDADFEKAYTLGRFGANPFIDETYLK